MKIPGDKTSGVEFPGVEQKLLSPSEDTESNGRRRRGTESDAIGRLIGNGTRPVTELGDGKGTSSDKGTPSSSNRSVVMMGMITVLAGIDAAAAADDDDNEDDCGDKECGMTSHVTVNTSESAAILEIPAGSVEIPHG